MARPADPELRPKLMKAAAHAFAERGFAAARIDEITSRAGYSKAAFYLHFETKDAVFRALVDEYVAGLEALVHDDDAFLSSDVVLPEAARELVFTGLLQKRIRIYEYIWGHREVYRTILACAGAEETALVARRVFERGRQRLERFLAWGIRQGLFRASVEPALASLFFTGAEERVTERIARSRTRPDLAAEAQRVQELMLRGLAPTP